MTKNIFITTFKILIRSYYCILFSLIIIFSSTSRLNAEEIAAHSDQSTNHHIEMNDEIIEQNESNSKELMARNLIQGIAPYDHYKGNVNAKVVMILYDSMSCSHCAYFDLNVLPEIDKNYIKTGKVLFINRNFPSDIYALHGSLASECYAKLKGEERYFMVKNLILKNQRNWLINGKNISEIKSSVRDALWYIMRPLGIEKEDLYQCFDDADLAKKIITQKREGIEFLGVDATPTIFINGKKYEGSHNYNTISEELNDLLKE